MEILHYDDESKKVEDFKIKNYVRVLKPIDMKYIDPLNRPYPSPYATPSDTLGTPRHHPAGHFFHNTEIPFDQALLDLLIADSGFDPHYRTFEPMQWM